MCDLLTIGKDFLIGMVSGLYSGVVVSRYFEFQNLKFRVWETILNMSGKIGTGSPDLQDPNAFAKLNFPSQQLRRAGHINAADEVDVVAKQIGDKLAEIKITSNEQDISSLKDNWLREAQNLKPCCCALIKPWLNG